MKIYIKKPFLTDAEKRKQDWVLRAKSQKVPLPMSWQNLKVADQSTEDQNPQQAVRWLRR
jgi:hypothetical protein